MTAKLKLRITELFDLSQSVVHKFLSYSVSYFRGLSSVVRKCVHKASGQEYAVKIVDKLSDHGSCDIGEVTKNESDILKTLSGHKNISKWCIYCYISCGDPQKNLPVMSIHF